MIFESASFAGSCTVVVFDSGIGDRPGFASTAGSWMVAYDRANAEGRRRARDGAARRVSVRSEAMMRL